MTSPDPLDNDMTVCIVDVDDDDDDAATALPPLYSTGAVVYPNMEAIVVVTPPSFNALSSGSNICWKNSSDGSICCNHIRDGTRSHILLYKLQHSIFG